MAMASIKLLILTMKERNFEYLQRLQLSCHSPYPVVFWEQRLGSANRCHGVAVLPQSKRIPCTKHKTTATV